MTYPHHYAVYDDYDTGHAVYDGESIENTPSYTARIGAAYYHPSGFYVRGDVKSQGAVPYYDTPNAKFREVDGFTVTDIRVGYSF